MSQSSVSSAGGHVAGERREGHRRQREGRQGRAQGGPAGGDAAGLVVSAKIMNYLEISSKICEFE